MIGIWYFSATGNGEKLAHIIAQEYTKEEVEITDITPYRKRNEIKTNIGYDKFIFIYPIYAGDVPDVVKGFLEKLKGENTPSILVTTWGSVHPSNALYNGKRILKERGFKVIAGAEIVAPHTYNNNIVKLGINRPSLEELIQFKHFIQEALLRDEEVVFHKERPSFMMRLPQRSIPIRIVKMGFNKEKCQYCNVCKKKCPVDAIREDMSIDESKCIRCLGCVKECKLQARSGGFKFLFPSRYLSRFQKKEQESRFYLS